MFIATIKESTTELTYHQWIFSTRKKALKFLDTMSRSHLWHYNNTNGKDGETWYESIIDANEWMIKDSGSNDEIHYFIKEINLDSTDGINFQ